MLGNQDFKLPQDTTFRLVTALTGGGESALLMLFFFGKRVCTSDQLADLSRKVIDSSRRSQILLAKGFGDGLHLNSAVSILTSACRHLSLRLLVLDQNVRDV